ncbi:MAG: hypothetical protein OXL68_01410 [Paracoccaceae bacterium]|nr:hypothetical protein [Paracoccaceae bacterium]
MRLDRDFDDLGVQAAVLHVGPAAVGTGALRLRRFAHLGFALQALLVGKTPQNYPAFDCAW